MNNNPSPGNKAGGLDHPREIAGRGGEGGTTNLVDVVEYAEPVTAKGFVYMDTPGYDPVSATGQVAGGANDRIHDRPRLRLWLRAVAVAQAVDEHAAVGEQEEDIDLNCGEIADGTASVDETGDACSPCCSRPRRGRRRRRRHGCRQNEFVPWYLGAVM
jgi:altronate hydrolase